MSPRVAVVGTYDRGYARTRNLIRWLQQTGCEVEERHVELWGERGEHAVKPSRLLRVGLRALVAYPRLVLALLRRPRPDLFLVAYPGHFDMPLVSFFARRWRIPIVFDIFISLFDTAVGDRELAGPRSLIGRVARGADRTACRLATLTLADTPVHAEFFSELSAVPPDRFRVQWLGAQEDLFRPLPEIPIEPDLVMFHGTFVPVQGIDTIIRAAKMLEPDGVRFRIIGKGQAWGAVKALHEELRTANVELVGLVPKEQIAAEVARAALCLGMFGTSAKADRVVPNKLFECVAVGRPVLTAATAAISAGFPEGTLATVPAGDPEALAAGIRELLADEQRREALARAGHSHYRAAYSDAVLAPNLRSHVDDAIRSVG